MGNSGLTNLGFSQYEATCYMALVEHHPVNGSRLSKLSGIARSRIYDVLRNLIAKGYVVEVQAGQYVPLPSKELIRQLKRQFNANIEAVEKALSRAAQEEVFQYIWTLKGFDNVISKAKEMIAGAKDEIYARMFPKADHCLAHDLVQAQKRGVAVRYIAMGDLPRRFEFQVAHPGKGDLVTQVGGGVFDVITDAKEALMGIFEIGNEDATPINWTRNHWFIVAGRDNLRHDFYHCFLEKILDQGLALTEKEQHMYQTIKQEI